MFRKTVLGVLAVAGLMLASTGTASAYYRGGYHGGYRGYGYRGGVCAPPVVVAPRVRYAYPPAYGYGVAPGYGYGYGNAYGYGGPGLGISTPGFGLYVR